MLMSFGVMAQVKIGFVDSQKLLDTMPSRKAAMEKYLAHEKELADEFNVMRSDLEKAYADYQAKQTFCNRLKSLLPLFRISTRRF